MVRRSQSGPLKEAAQERDSMVPTKPGAKKDEEEPGINGAKRYWGSAEMQTEPTMDPTGSVSSEVLHSPPTAWHRSPVWEPANQERRLTLTRITALKVGKGMGLQVRRAGGLGVVLCFSFLLGVIACSISECLG